MKRSKPIASPVQSPRPSLPDVRSRAELRDLQRRMAEMILRPLTGNYRTQRVWIDGRRTTSVAAEIIKPNDRLTSFERLEIYNRCYWFRVLDCLCDDYPGLRAVLGEKKFDRLVSAYLERFPSASFTLRNLGSRLAEFIRENPGWTAPRTDLALDMARFEWAQIVAFDGEAIAPITTDDLLDSKPARLRLRLQPYITLIELSHPVDDFVIALKKKREVLRSEASNTVDTAPTEQRSKRPPLPRRSKTLVAVHRCDNALYYKRLDPAAYAMLSRLQKGATVEQACAAAFPLSRDPEGCSAQIREHFNTWAMLGWFCKPTSRR